MEVSEARRSGEQVIRQPLGTRVLRCVAGEASAGDDGRIPITRPVGAELDVVVADGTEQPVEIQDVTAELAPMPWVYFESPGTETLTARFGDSKLRAPRYDLESARATAMGGAFPEAQWGARAERRGETAPTGQGNGSGQPLGVLAGLLALVAALFIWAVFRIKKRLE